MEIVAHPDFGKGEMEGDIALMKLAEPVELSKWVQPICLPETGRDFELEYVHAMGWGITSNGKFQQFINRQKETFYFSLKNMLFFSLFSNDIRKSCCFSIKFQVFKFI